MGFRQASIGLLKSTTAFSDELCPEWRYPRVGCPVPYKGREKSLHLKKMIYFHMKSYASFLRMGLALVGLGLSSCAVSTPGSRVAQAPQLYQPLPAGQKTAVMEGRVVEGMPPDAVFLALGRPDRVVRGSANGIPMNCGAILNYSQSTAPAFRPDTVLAIHTAATMDTTPTTG